MASRDPTVALIQVPPTLTAVAEAGLSRVWAGRIQVRPSVTGERPVLAVIGGPDPAVVWNIASAVEQRWPAVPCLALVDGARLLRSHKRLPSSVAWALEADELEAPLLAVALRYALEHGLRRRLERQLEEDRALVDVGWVASAVSHEIGNPLTSLLTNLEVVQGQLAAHHDRKLPIDVPSSLAAVTDALDGARHVSRVAMDLGRASRRAGRVAPIEVRSVLETARRLAAEPLAGIEVRLLSRRVRPVRGDETRLCQVFLNLMKNAAQALDGCPDPRLEFSIQQERNEVVVRVSDNGPGVTEEMRGRLFQPWYTTRSDGSGLGLALSRRYVEAMGGRLTLLHTDTGASFEVRLPASVRTGTSRPTLVPDRTEVGAKVLVVDDTALVRRAIQRALEPCHRVVLTAHFEAAVAALEHEPFDVMLLDLHLTGRSGIEVYEELCASFPGRARKVVFLSGAFSQTDLAYLEQRGLPWVRKPIGAGTLRDLVVELSTASG